VTKLYKKRNPVAQAAILRKGGVHDKSRKTKRQKQKSELRKTVSKEMATYRGHSFILSQCIFISDITSTDKDFNTIKF